ncbi:hypothetical protein ES703_44238 [subsurface metagenome]
MRKELRAKYGDYKNDERVCPTCGKKFKVQKWSPQKFCSRQCGNEPRKGKTLVTKVCPQCQKEFQSEPWEKQKFCSVKCGIDFNKGKPRVTRAKCAPSQRTRNRGERKTKDGRRVRLPRYLMEQKLGRKLKTEETVHHRDMDVHNNPIDCSNFYLYPNESKHMKGHHSLEKLVPVLVGQGIIEFVDGKYILGKGTGRKG